MQNTTIASVVCKNVRNGPHRASVKGLPTSVSTVFELVVLSHAQAMNDNGVTNVKKLPVIKSYSKNRRTRKPTITMNPANRFSAFKRKQPVRLQYSRLTVRYAVKLRSLNRQFGMLLHNGH